MALNDTVSNSTAWSLLFLSSPSPAFPLMSSLSSRSAALPSRNGTPTVEPEDASTVSNDASAVVGALILGLVFLLGVPGNLFIIWSILARARKRSITTLLILNLACADGFLMTLTIFFVVYLAKRTWVFGNGMCKALFYLCNVNMYASILLITLMSLHRLLAVVWPQRVGALTRRRTVLRLLGALWLLVLLMSVPAVLFREEREDTADYGRARLVCAPTHALPQQVVFQYLFETVMGFILPYGVIVCSYVCILHRIRQTRFRRRIRSEKLILAIVVTFGLFWLPYHVINMVQVAAELAPESSNMRKRLDYVWRSSRAVTSSLAFISSCANPVLYTFAGKAYMRQDGLAFMVRLFEGTALDSGTRKGPHSSRDQEGLGLQSRDEPNCITTAANTLSRER
ncbi:hypothetical protein AAFF_G00122390 [Aldrovandia affinis]|uniref:G-protein coupled receptors family 1 profile domain-containing protein n=1 Tax=Aldrovandia affinis TaxID=143900 RepID=A0AAD7WAW5_9TELE|nr:hypothetical protein AAFF_G00122390 [Aldrovandia affinis]